MVAANSYLHFYEYIQHIEMSTTLSRNYRTVSQTGDSSAHGGSNCLGIYVCGCYVYDSSADISIDKLLLWTSYTLPLPGDVLLYSCIKENVSKYMLIHRSLGVSL